MTGYVRQSEADILPGETVRSAPLNAEFNAIEGAFGTSGHTHDGTAGNGPKLSLAAISSLKRNATADPTSTDDSGDGYEVGSLWINVTSDEAFICVDNSVGAALWDRISNSDLYMGAYSSAPTINEGGSALYAGQLYFNTGTKRINVYDGSAWGIGIEALPSQTGNSGKQLTTNGTITSWVQVIPSQTGNSGKQLTTNGTIISWVQVIPSQTGNSGKLLTTDGSSVAWANRFNRQTFTSSGTWSKPADCTFVKVRLIAGGQAGYNGTGSYGIYVRGGNGGRGGDCTEETYLASDLGSSVSVTIGAGGSSNGAAGGITSFGTTQYATNVIEDGASNKVYGGGRGAEYTSDTSSVAAGSSVYGGQGGGSGENASKPRKVGATNPMTASTSTKGGDGGLSTQKGGDGAGKGAGGGGGGNNGGLGGAGANGYAEIIAW